jgi:hypothetical protein
LVLPWRPKVGLDEGLEKTIAYFDRVLSARNDAIMDGGRAAQHTGTRTGATLAQNATRLEV